MKEELCNCCKKIKTYRKTNNIPKCAICEIPKLEKKEVVVIYD